MPLRCEFTKLQCLGEKVQFGLLQVTYLQVSERRIRGGYWTLQCLAGSRKSTLPWATLNSKVFMLHCELAAATNQGAVVNVVGNASN